MSSILKVSEIQDPTNGNSALTVDSSGRVLTPQRVHFYASASEGNVDVIAESLLPFTAVYQNVGNAFSTSTYLFTAPVTGMYLFVTSGFVASASSAVGRITWEINGNQFLTGGDITEARIGTDRSGSMQGIFGLTAGDTMGIRLRASVSTVQFYMGHCDFSGCLLG